MNNLWRLALLISVFAAGSQVYADCSQTATPLQAVTFSVTADGTQPFGYQWYKDGTAINGATNITYDVSAVGPGDAGTYYALVSNSAGTTWSDNAVLTVTSVPPKKPISGYRLVYIPGVKGLVRFPNYEKPKLVLLCRIQPHVGKTPVSPDSPKNT